MVAVTDPRQAEPHHIEMEASAEPKACVGIRDVNGGGFQEVVIESGDEIGESTELDFGCFGIGVGGCELRKDPREVKSMVIDDAVDDGDGLFACHSASAHTGIDFDVEGKCAAE